MNKKILTLLVTLLTLGLFSISCSEKPTDPETSKPTGIDETYRGNTYKGQGTITQKNKKSERQNVELTITIEKDGSIISTTGGFDSQKIPANKIEKYSKTEYKGSETFNGVLNHFEFNFKDTTVDFKSENEYVIVTGTLTKQ